MRTVENFSAEVKFVDLLHSEKPQVRSLLCAMAIVAPPKLPDFLSSRICKA